jgi:hypothetical protein
MPQQILIKRNMTAVAVPGALGPGELAVNISGAANNLYVGDAVGTALALVNPSRQVETSGNQGPITGTKTFGPTGVLALDDVANLLLPGGNAGEFVSTDGAGNLTFAPALTQAQQFVGSADGATGGVTLTADVGGGAVLPAAGPANDGWYVIYAVAGATKPPNSGAGVVGPFDIGDWLISNGTTWTHLAYGGSASVTAADVGVAPTVAGANNVQDALEALETAQGNFVVGPAAAIDSNLAAFDTVTGLLIKDSLSSVTSILNQAKTYVDTANTAQDTAQDTRDDAQDVLIAANTASIASKGDVFGPPLAVQDRIAVFDDNTGKLIADGGTTIGAINTSIGLKADKAYVDTQDALAVLLAGSTMTGVLLLSEHPAAGDDPFQATTKQYVDDGLASVAAGASVLVTGPELTGNGLLGTEITFMGITTAPAGEFGGNGLSGAPLTLLICDGGTYV